MIAPQDLLRAIRCSGDTQKNECNTSPIIPDKAGSIATPLYRG
jgi:hypothetical protein